MEALLLKNIGTVVTFNDKDEILENVDILVEGPKITSIGKKLSVPDKTDIIDCTNLVALPGFVNTHHHLYQTLFRGIKEVQEKPLFPWLIGLYEFWKNITPDAVYYGALVGFSELLRTGCTLTSDHHYVFPNNQPQTLIDDEIRAAKEIGIRFTATRGSMSLGRDQGGLPPMTVVQEEDKILEDSYRLISKYHDVNDFSMTRIALAPCSPFSVTKELMLKTKDLARKRGVMMHTHLAETLDEERFCIEKYGRRPFELMEELEWVGSDVWYAHGIYLSDAEIDRLSGTGIAHCPSSNMKLSSGICRTSEIVQKGGKISIGVDGSASNDGSNMWEEIRRAYLLNHLKYGTKGLNAYEMLKIATRGGADVLGRIDTGRLDREKAADIILFDLSGVEYAGCHDPLVSLVCLGNSSYTKMTIVNGKIVSIDGKLITMNTDEIAKNAHKIAQDIVKHERENNL
ncbi:8-oxoguanine deaminase [Clostridium autoethanogenum]|uniref:8-oxoguanine deaminase n=1 Tax=Clostridium autoethanogenum DSM 10061 TaxID=1341692 RepID=A0ABN4BGE0_9CLOT|nr:8-oxoguanine deaminase [Clostridium autoethanogenum]AGY75283.1 8-oxoguanine deaminase [Clostridium autoethanogenum DSM 10061]ALU35450.1 Hydroxydechloroatrazine ethylaminohydrolase [Clostridium autoethanogenum DSM 10061]OVY48591.1 8-oxoguanine deaminase [Clostridium autoethanogenum]